MAKSGPKITNMASAENWLAAYCSDNENGIPERIVPVICWTSLEFDDDPDEVVGQIFDGACITEATSVDQEEGFGEFVGYFQNHADAVAGINLAETDRKMRDGEDEEGDGEDEGDEDEDGAEDEEESEEEEGEEEGSEEEDEEDEDEEEYEDEDEDFEDDLEDEDEEDDED